MGEPNPEEPVTLSQPWSVRRHPEPGELLAQRQVLGDQGCPGSKERAQGSDDQADRTHHAASIRVQSDGIVADRAASGEVRKSL